MLHAPVSENKTKEQQSKTQSETEGYRRSGGWVGYDLLSPGSGRLFAPFQQTQQAVMQKAYGNQAVLRKMGRSSGNPSVKASLLSQGSVLQRKCACGNTAGSSGSCAECQKEQGMTLQRKREADSLTEVPDIVHEVLRSPGQPLDADTRTFMESRFGQDFSQVRVYTDEKAVRSARAVNALAYTVGRDLVFGRGEYEPKTIRGQFLLAHELTHVLQQGNRNSTPIRLGKNDDQHEIEANAISIDILTSPKLSTKISSLGGKQSEPGTVQGGWPVIVGVGVGLGAGIYAIWAYRCLKPLEIPMYNATFGDTGTRRGGFRLWYYNQTSRPVPSNVWDAFGHCWIACASTQRCGAFTANLAGSAREWYRENIDSEPHDSYRQDLNNQRLGRGFGSSGEDCSIACQNAALPGGAMDLSAPRATFWDPSRGDYASVDGIPADEALASGIPETPSTEAEA